MMQLDPHHWWMNEEKERKKRQQASDISLINKQLQILLSEVTHGIDKNKYQEAATKMERLYHFTGSGIWRLCYVNNFESEKVALAQARLISHILHEESLKREAFFTNRLDTLMRQLGNANWSIYLEYGKFKGKIS